MPMSKLTSATTIESPTVSEYARHGASVTFSILNEQQEQTVQLQQRQDSF